MRAWLVVELEGSRLGASLIIEARGEPRPVVHGERDIDRERVHELVIDVGRILNRGSRWADGDQGSRDLLRKKGAVLFDAVLPQAVKAAVRGIDSGQLPVELVISASRSLAWMPWESLHTGHGFLGLLFAIGRDEPRTRTENGPLLVEPVASAGRMLVVADPRGDLLGSYYEGLTLRDELGTRTGHLTVDLRSSEVGIADVVEILREYDIVHYAGHVEPAPEAGERGWWLRDGVLGPSIIRELGGGRFPRLVFANACRSARVEPDDQDCGASLAASFLEAGAAHVIGTVWDVPDEPASGFALAFYAHLVGGCSIGEAVRRARVELSQRYGEDSIFWAAWVLHGDPTSASFARQEPEHTATLAATDGTPRGLAAVAGRVRGAAFEGAPPVVELAAPSQLWLRSAVALAGLAAIVALALGLGPRGDVIVARPVRTADLGPAERFPPQPIERLPSAPEPALPASERPMLLEVLAELEGTAVSTRTLASGQSFRLRWRVPSEGWASVWQVESQGGVRRIYPADAGLAAVPGDSDIELPGGGRWFFLDDRKGTEHFFLAWRQSAPADEAAFLAELESEVRSLTPSSNPGLELRGLGGTRHDAARAGSADVAERFGEVLMDRFERVEAVEVEHR